MNLGVGLIGNSDAWMQLLKTEGVPYVLLDETSPAGPPAVVVVGRELRHNDVEYLRSYLGAGGGVLAYAGYLATHGMVDVKNERVSYLLPSEHSCLEIGLLDLDMECQVPRGAGQLRTDTGSFAVIIDEWGGGNVALLPFDPAQVLMDERSCHRNFYAHRDRLATEQVSTVGKGEVQQLLHSCLSWLYTSRGMPYLHLAYWPGENPSLFAFRIDTDRGTKHDVHEMGELCREYDVHPTWFLDVGSSAGFLDLFGGISGDECGVHCNRHVVYKEFDENVQNLSSARSAMEQAGLVASGFASPYGLWNRSLAKAIDTLGFEYSSEFSYAYDALPFFPEYDGKRSSAIQIPVHPICRGTLARAGYKSSDMKRYYRDVVDRKIARGEACFFFDHPGADCLDAISFLLGHVRDRGIKVTTMGGMCEWWKNRLRTSFTARMEKGKPSIHVQSVPVKDLALTIIDREKGWATVPLHDSVDLSEVAWHTRSADNLIPPDIRRVRDFDLRSFLASVYTHLTRRRK